MKIAPLITLLALTIALPTLAGVNSINPEKTVVNLFKVYGYSKVKGTQIEVRGPRYSGQVELEDEGEWFQIPAATFNRAQKLATSVFRTDSGEGSEAHGTSFSIGNNLVLTNQHVLSPSRKNTTKCGSFSLRTNEKSSEVFDCKEVIFCEPKRDFCLIELKPNTHKERINGKKVVVQTNLSRIPHLKLDTNYKLDASARYSLKTFTVIGNTSGFGIHYSEGKEAYLINNDYYFFASLAPGNSGGPLLDEKGNIVAIAKQQSSSFYGNGTDVYNVAIPIREVVETLKEKLQNRPEVIKKLNQAILSL